MADKKNKFTKFLLAGLGLVALLAVLTVQTFRFAQKDYIIWDAIHVSGSDSSGDAHLLEMPNGDFFLIDTGYQKFAESDLLPFLQQRGVEKLVGLLVTHAHKNHYGSVLDVLAQIPIDRVYFNLPDHEICGREKSRGRCEVSHVNETIESINRHSQVVAVKANDVLYQGDDNTVTLSVLFQANDPKSIVFSGQDHQGWGRFSLNDSSIVSRLSFGEQSILFPGDIGTFTGHYLANNFSAQLQATLLAAPHHGVTPLPPLEFFEAVNPQAFVLSISPPPFVGERGKLIREFSESKKIPLWKTAGTKSVKVKLSKTHFERLGSPK